MSDGSNSIAIAKPIDFGTWRPYVDQGVLGHIQNDGRTKITLQASCLQYNDEGQVCAKQTAQNVWENIRTTYGISPEDTPDPSKIRWDKSAEVTALLGSTHGKQLLTFVSRHPH